MSIVHEEYDCKEKKYRAVYVASYSEKMQGGKITWSHSKPAEGFPIGPDSVKDAIFNFACNTN